MDVSEATTEAKIEDPPTEDTTKIAALEARVAALEAKILALSADQDKKIEERVQHYFGGVGYFRDGKFEYVATVQLKERVDKLEKEEATRDENVMHRMVIHVDDKLAPLQRTLADLTARIGAPSRVVTPRGDAAMDDAAWNVLAPVVAAPPPARQPRAWENWATTITHEFSTLAETTRELLRRLVTHQTMAGMRQVCSDKPSSQPWVPNLFDDDRVEAMAFSTFYWDWGNSKIIPLKEPTLPGAQLILTGCLHLGNATQEAQNIALGRHVAALE